MKDVRTTTEQEITLTSGVKCIKTTYYLNGQVAGESVRPIKSIKK